MLSIVQAPANFMASTSSAVIFVSMLRTPGAPSEASAQQAARPTRTACAPKGERFEGVHAIADSAVIEDRQPWSRLDELGQHLEHGRSLRHGVTTVVGSDDSVDRVIARKPSVLYALDSLHEQWQIGQRSEPLQVRPAETGIDLFQHETYLRPGDPGRELRERSPVATAVSRTDAESLASHDSRIVDGENECAAP